MAIERRVAGDGSVRWRVSVWTDGRGSQRRIWTFDRKRDAEMFEARLRQRRALGELQGLTNDETLADLQADWLRYDAMLNLQQRTLEDYAAVLDNTCSLASATSSCRSSRRRSCDASGRSSRPMASRAGPCAVRSWSCRRSAGYGLEEERLTRNPVKAVRKPSGRRQRSVAVLVPDQVEAIRQTMLERGRVGEAALVSTLAYAGLRPQEALALEWRHIRRRTLVVEQKNVDGRIMPGQKTGRPPRTVDLIEPLREDLAAWRKASGGPGEGLLIFPTRAAAPWRAYDWGNWDRRVWRPAAIAAGVHEPPYSLRHSFASLALYAGQTIIELAAQMGHSPAICLSTYQHVMADLKGSDREPAADRIAAARRELLEQAAEGLAESA